MVVSASKGLFCETIALDAGGVGDKSISKTWFFVLFDASKGLFCETIALDAGGVGGKSIKSITFCVFFLAGAVGGTFSVFFAGATRGSLFLGTFSVFFAVAI